MIPLSKNVGINGRSRLKFFPVTAMCLAGVSDRGGRARKLSLRPVVIILVAVWSPRLSHWDLLYFKLNSQIFWFSGSSGRTLCAEKAVCSLCFVSLEGMG